MHSCQRFNNAGGGEGEQQAQLVSRCIESVLDDPNELEDLYMAHWKVAKHNVVGRQAGVEPHQQQANDGSNQRSHQQQTIDLPQRLRQLYHQPEWSTVESDELKMSLKQQLYYARHIAVVPLPPPPKSATTKTNNAKTPLSSAELLMRSTANYNVHFGEKRMFNNNLEIINANGEVELNNTAVNFYNLQKLVQLKVQRYRLSLAASAARIDNENAVQVCTFCKNNEEPL